jgi:ATPase subunit of ABC transporter with duplicated ATPase domains
MKTASDPPDAGLPPQTRRRRVGIVGPCTAGKSTLIYHLGPLYAQVELRHIAQEHSYVQYMWQRISAPDWLVFIDVSYPVTLQRKNLNWTEAEYLEQQRRLAHAREHADLYIDTDPLTPAEVAEKVKSFLASLGFEEKP